MKVLYVTCYLEDDPNGVARVSFELAHAFSQKYETAIICPGVKQEVTKEKSGLTKYSVKSVQVLQVNINKFSGKEVQGILNFLEDFSPDIIHSHSPADLGLIAQAWAIAHDIPYICTVHSLPTQMHKWMNTKATSTFSIIQEPIVSFATQKYLLQILSNCTAVIALNKPAFADIKKLGYTGDLITIPNGFKMDLYQKHEPTDITTSPKELLYVGSITYRKNQDFLIRVMKHLPKDYRLHIVGGVQDEDYNKILKKTVQKESLQNIIFHGAVPHYEISKIQRTSHIFVSASLAEVQSTAILESLASGTPVVALSNQTVDEFIDEKVGYNLPQDTSPEIFAKKVKAICDLDSNKYEQLCQDAKKRIEQFDLNKVVERMEQMYLGYISAPPKRTKSNTSQQLKNLITNIPEGTIRTTIEETLDEWEIKRNRKKSKNAPDLKKLSLTTLILTVITIVISAIAYFLLVNTKSRKKKDDKDSS